jgi:phosphoribulokinase
LIGEDLVATIAMDGYHKEDRDRRKLTGRLPLDPDANYLDLLVSHLKALKMGKTVDIPIYNHHTGKFDPPVPLAPQPIIIVEGLHALYPEFLSILDFSIYVDPSNDVKWKWKWERDIIKRGHRAETLAEEMLKREAAYKRWLDFQKTSATVVIKIFNSQLRGYDRLGMESRLPEDCQKVELLVEPAEIPLPNVLLPFDLARMLEAKQAPFLLMAVPVTYWGRSVMMIHLDGVFSSETIGELEANIVSYTGIPIQEGMGELTDPASTKEYNATQFAQLLITWRFLELVNYRIAQAHLPAPDCLVSG